jgi:hypothetical protein
MEFQRRLEAALHRHVWLYKRQLQQSDLRSKSPLQVTKECYNLNLKLF